MSARIRCPEGCPDRKPGCHDEKTCECWARQLEQRRNAKRAGATNAFIRRAGHSAESSTRRES